MPRYAQDTGGTASTTATPATAPVLQRSCCARRVSNSRIAAANCGLQQFLRPGHVLAQEFRRANRWLPGESAAERYDCRLCNALPTTVP